MKRNCALLFALLLSLSLGGCSSPGVTQQNSTVTPFLQSSAPAVSTVPASPTPSPTPSPSPTEPADTATAAPAPTGTPAPTPTPFAADMPDKAGEKGILFDIYTSKAAVDLNMDGKPEQIIFKAAKTPTLTINGKKFAIIKSGLAQSFAITNIDKNDKTLEIVLTQKYDSGLADSEKAYSWLYWWDGKSLILMGGMMDVKYDGKWRGSFHAAKYLNGTGQVTCLARTTEFTDIWYMAHYKAATAKRTLKEAEYAAKLVNQHGKLTVKTCCLLLKTITTKYFKTASIGMYDPASWPHADGRLPVTPAKADYTVIVQAGEKVSIVAVYGQNWFKLKTADGHQGWIKVVDGKVQGYWQVMKWTVDDIFDGIMIAG